MIDRASRTGRARHGVSSAGVLAYLLIVGVHGIFAAVAAAAAAIVLYSAAAAPCVSDCEKRNAWAGRRKNRPRAGVLLALRCMVPA